ncbi:glycosyltransferase [Candidatus Bipolaricaulota bacterium]|nr:glycosyltransferase [Candidatus Bipolaricaulota bacterium]
MFPIILIVASLSLLIWLGLLFGRGKFWRMNQRLYPLEETEVDHPWPSVCAIIPARNESEALPESLPSVLGQEYPGDLNVILVNDNSEDNTGELAEEIAEKSAADANFQVIVPPPTPEGWAGKVWALHHGFQRAKKLDPDLIWLTDADIVHDPETLRTLTHKLEDEGLNLASIMADLRTDSFWEKLLIPNFVYYFSMVYPFSWVNDPEKDTAAAAGGCVLARRSTLENSGGFEAISGAVIDDCALARGCSNPEGEGLWLGLSHMVTSVRNYGSLSGVWSTVSRSAFSQLGYSNLILLGTVVGMIVLFLVPPGSVALGIIGLVGLTVEMHPVLSSALIFIGGLTWLGMGASFFPILNWYGLSPAYGVLAPVGGFLYTLMTIDSGLTWWRREGSKWKGRTISVRGD